MNVEDLRKSPPHLPRQWHGRESVRYIVAMAKHFLTVYYKTDFGLSGIQPESNTLKKHLLDLRLLITQDRVLTNRAKNILCTLPDIETGRKYSEK